MAITLDPAFNPTRFTLSAGNMRATALSDFTNQYVRTTSGFTAGKMYFEASCFVNNGGGSCVGIVNPNGGAGHLGGTLYGWDYAANGIVYNNGGTVATLASYNPGNLVCVAVDIANKKLWFRFAAGNWNGIAGNDPATNVGGYDLTTLLANSGLVYPALGSFNINDSMSLNLGATAFTQTAPVGFVGPDAPGGGAQARVAILA